MPAGRAASLPLVSVVTPALNAGRFVEQTIRSVLAQDYPRIEHILLLAGSTDETAEIAARHSPPLRVVAEGPVEQSPKVNRGFRLARGKIVGWLNADDVYLPGAVSEAVSALLAEPSLGMVCSDYVEIDELGRELRRIECPDFDLERQLNHGNLVSQPTVFLRREVVESVGGLDERYRYVQDYELWLRVGREFPVRHVGAYWAGYRRHGGQESEVNRHRFGPELRRASRRHGGRFFSELGRTHSRPLRVARMVRERRFALLAEKAASRVRR